MKNISKYSNSRNRTDSIIPIGRLVPRGPMGFHEKARHKRISTYLYRKSTNNRCMHRNHFTQRDSHLVGSDVS